LRLAKASQRF